MSIRKIIVSSSQCYWECTIAFDTSKTTTCNGKEYTLDDNLRESLEFFSAGKDAIKEANGDLCNAYARFISRTIMKDSMDHTLAGIIELFNGYEGYLPLDGSSGVTLVRMADFEIEDEFDTEELS